MALSFGKTPEPDRTTAGLCVVGNLTIDVILRGITTMPEWGQEVLCRDRTESVAGQAGAMAFAASALGVTTNIVTSVEVSAGDSADCPRLEPLLASTAKRFPAISEVSADKGYLSRRNMDVIVNAGAVPYIPFKVTSNAKGSELWRRLFHTISTAGVSGKLPQAVERGIHVLDD